MEKVFKKPTADEIAQMAERDEDIFKHFSNKGKIKYPVQRVNVDFNIIMLRELDDIANELNISRQALIKTYLRHALDNHYLAQQRSMR